MSDFKSKLPDLKELASMTSKLYTDIKKSVGEIVQSYKENRVQPAGESEQVKTQPPKEEIKTESKPVQERQPIKQEETPNPEEQAVDAPIKDDSKK
ncbi:hypothetical protein Lsan_2265 [Legionella santicrucis]|uniref:Uncharacterized protein n=1 Tax=Legionella santicrucis TaxID=45074 RepID=A0A0W0YR55_9GAMM|nr:hypothetical protein [Legionella santicrucis]KTD59361.1 hypothetical protein Lsan_2265 [Legionella santicrucis]